MPDIQNLMNRTKNDQKDVEARSEPKKANKKPRTKKELVQNIISEEVYLTTVKAGIPMPILILIFLIIMPILRQYIELGSFQWRFPYDISNWYGWTFFFFTLGKVLEKDSWSDRFQSGEFVSLESIEELEKRKKATITRRRYWLCSLFLLGGIFIGAMIPSFISENITPPNFSNQTANCN